MNITIIDYGLGNLFNLQRAFKAVGTETEISDRPETILAADKIVLPGVGAFASGMQHLQEKALVEVLNAFHQTGKDMLGICLGMQLLLTESEENGQHQGLDYIKGKVIKFAASTAESKTFKVPQISWNTLHIQPSHANWDGTILSGLDQGAHMYFVHSYHVQVEDANDCIALTEYGHDTFCSVVQKDNVMGCQFHPERSGVSGLNILKNFVVR